MKYRNLLGRALGRTRTLRHLHTKGAYCTRTIEKRWAGASIDFHSLPARAAAGTTAGSRLAALEPPRPALAALTAAVSAGSCCCCCAPSLAAAAATGCAAGSAPWGSASPAPSSAAAFPAAGGLAALAAAAAATAAALVAAACSIASHVTCGLRQSFPPQTAIANVLMLLPKLVLGSHGTRTSPLTRRGRKPVGSPAPPSFADTPWPPSLPGAREAARWAPAAPPRPPAGAPLQRGRAVLSFWGGSCCQRYPSAPPRLFRAAALMGQGPAAS